MSCVQITGLGVLSALGTGRAAFETGLRAGASPIRLVEIGGRPELAARIADFDAGDFVGADALPRMGRHAQLAVAAARLAGADAGLPRADFDDAALVLGGNYGDPAEALAGHDRLLAQRRVTPFHHARTAVASAAGWVSQQLGIRGPGACLSTSSAAGAQALAHAARLLRAGEAEVVLAGGAEAALSPIAIGGLRAAGVLSKRVEDPARSLRPFDRERDGTVPGEGAVVLVLETEEHARNRGVRAIAELAGWGEAMDAHHPYAPSPDGHAMRSAITLALSRAGLRAELVEHVNAHGTGTRVGDAIEALVLQDSFPHGPPVTAIKPLTGHLLGAAGAIDAAACAVGLSMAFLPRIAGLERSDDGVDLDLVSGTGRDLTHDVALSLSHGFGGFATALLFRRA